MHLFHCIKNDYQKLFCPPQILREVSSFPPNFGRISTQFRCGLHDADEQRGWVSVQSCR